MWRAHLRETTRTNILFCILAILSFAKSFELAELTNRGERPVKNLVRLVAPQNERRGGDCVSISERSKPPAAPPFPIPHGPKTKPSKTERTSLIQPSLNATFFSTFRYF